MLYAFSNFNAFIMNAAGFAEAAAVVGL